MSIGRRVVAAVAPEWVKQRHESLTTRRFRSRVGRLNRSFAAQHDLVVQRGPFAGLRYPESLLDASDLVSKLVGTYELEVHDVMREWIARVPQRVVNVGAAEGFFAVGLARTLPGATLFAYEIERAARARCVRLAQANGVTERLRAHRECTTEDLERLGPGDTVLLSDCEGCERELLDPERAPVLRGWELLVELHDFVDPTISTTMRARFAGTHDITMIPSRSRVAEDPPELRAFSRRDRQLLLGERRPAPMQWAWMRPRSE